MSLTRAQFAAWITSLTLETSTWARDELIIMERRGNEPTRRENVEYFIHSMRGRLNDLERDLNA